MKFAKKQLSCIGCRTLIREMICFFVNTVKEEKQNSIASQLPRVVDIGNLSHFIASPVTVSHKSIFLGRAKINRYDLENFECQLLFVLNANCHVVDNCLSALQEIWSSEASHSEEAAYERDGLLSKPFVYYLLNRLLAYPGC